MLHYYWFVIEHVSSNHYVFTLFLAQKCDTLFDGIFDIKFINYNTSKQLEHKEATKSNYKDKEEHPTYLMLKLWLFSNTYSINGTIRDLSPTFSSSCNE